MVMHLGVGANSWAASFYDSGLELIWLQKSPVTWICSLITSGSSGFRREYS